MSLVIPNAGELLVLQYYLQTVALTLKLYSNDYTPVEGTTTAAFTEVTGGGYTPKTLNIGDWILSASDPSNGVYSQQTFSFTGPTTAPGTIYGYYVIDNLGVTRWAERFPGANIPFTPINGSRIRLTPRLECT